MGERDSTTDRLLRQRLAGAEPHPGSDCLDAETVAAWIAGSLPAPRRRAAEAHAADCSRCLAMLAATAQTEPSPERPWWRRVLPAGWMDIRWLAPVTAAAVVLVMTIVQRSGDVTIDHAPAQQAEQIREIQRGEADRELSAVPPAEPATSAARALPDGRDAPAAAEHGNVAERRAAAPTAPRPPGESSQAGVRQEGAQVPLSDLSATQASQAARADAAISEPREAFSREFAASAFEIASPDPAIRWRVSGSTVERSTDAGRTWLAQTTAAVPLVAGSAPSPAVCWVVGRSGTVLLSTDGETWAVRPSPDPADLVAVSAEGPDSAVVTTREARAYRTADGGRTWTLQEKPAAPF